MFAGDRSGEFEERLEGVSYEAIARAGGGIASTVRATRQASAADLAASARRRLDALRAEGVTTIEIKSGYGLDLETEIRMLEVARALGRAPGIDVITSFLGAHALPPEYAGDRSGYLDLVCEQVLPEVAARRLADAVDAFCEDIAFTPAEVARVFATARRLGLPVKLHADQLSDLGGAELAARFDALSADHLECVSEAGVRAMAASRTVAVLLPGAFYTLRETRKPPVDWLRRYGVPIALATDCNPGSSPVTSLLAMLNMACTLFGLTPGGGARRGDAQRCAGARTERPRHARGGPASGPCALARPSPGRAKLLVGLGAARGRTQGWPALVSCRDKVNLLVLSKNCDESVS